jgi:hypothetical protein
MGKVIRLKKMGEVAMEKQGKTIVDRGHIEDKPWHGRSPHTILEFCGFVFVLTER